MRVKRLNPRKAVDAWNAKHPTGTRVRRYRLMDPLSEPAEETTTEGPAWVLSGHSAMVRLKGLTGCYELGCIEVLS